MITESAPDIETPAIVIDIGNHTVGMATWFERKVRTPVRVGADNLDEIEAAVAAHFDACTKGRPSAVIVGSVVPEVLEQVESILQRKMNESVLIVGENLPLPIDVAVDDPKAIGVDRVCSAAAAYDEVRNACTVIDFGTAVTVDLVDGDGTLLGGAILPGLHSQIRSLHEYTALLPQVEPGFPETPYGRNTVEAIQTGVCRGLAGAVRGLVEGYAATLNQWPQVVVTGGDAAFMLPHCDFVDTAVDGLVLRGIGLAYSNHISDLGA